MLPVVAKNVPEGTAKEPDDKKTVPKALVRNESTRNRVQARTGLKGKGQNKSFKYAHPDELDEKLKEGKEWVRRHWVAQGLPVHELQF